MLNTSFLPVYIEGKVKKRIQKFKKKDKTTLVFLFDFIFTINYIKMFKLGHFILFSDITIGQYFPGESFIHRLDPRTKLISLMLFMTGLLFAYHFLSLAIYFVLIIVMLFGSQLPPRLVLGNLKPFFWLFILTLLIHIWNTPGTVVFSCSALHLNASIEGIRLGLIFGIRLALLVLFAAFLTLTASPIEITDALEKMLSPLKRLGVPVHELVMMLTLSLRFIPTLLEEAEQLKNAQVSRGARFGGNLLQRLKSTIPLVLPLFISAFRRADDLALAMDSRCYGSGARRSSYKILRYAKTDYMVLSASLITVIFLFFLERSL